MPLDSGDSGRPYKMRLVSKYFSKGEKGSSVSQAVRLLRLSNADIYFKVHLVGPPRLARVELGLDLQITPLPSS